MKRFYILITAFVFLYSLSLFANTTVNGRFVLIQHNLSEYTVKFQINTNTGTDTLGCSTIIFNFDSTALSYPESPVANTDYTFLNFNGTYYNSTITRPLPNQIWVNIESLNSSKGTVVAQDPGWTDVVQLTFHVLNHSGSSNLTWETTDNNWAIYDADNSTIWEVGTWTDENTSPLPVELTTFSANVENSNEVNLTWQTATELNNYGFDIERKIAGNNSAWEKIGFVAGQVQSNTTENYNFTDKNTDFTKAYYRLKQIDTQGSFKYSNEVEVDITPKSFTLYQNYPNPFNPSTTIKFSVPYKSHVNITIYDVTGKEISSLVNEEKSAGTYSVNFNARNLSSGMYLYRIACGNFTQVKKMLLLK